MLSLANDEIAQLIRGQELVRFPPVRTPTPLLESFYADLVKEFTNSTGCAEKTEWNHYGSGYASFVDAWFYFPDGSRYFNKRWHLRAAKPGFMFLRHWSGRKDMATKRREFVFAAF
jgi:hypothetical protein